jgi:glycerophosphoryl diester phosphodiesterase
MKKLLVVALLLIGMNESIAQSQTKIIAHRGAWKEFNLPENSIASLEKAIDLKCYGSEFDVRCTKDGILVVNHDPVYYGDTIELKTYAELNKKKLSNGEDLPTLAAYFEKGTEQKHKTLLICEIKQAITNPMLDEEVTRKTVDMVKKMGIEKRVVYISFRFEILQWIKALNTKATVLYLESDKTVESIKEANFNGINYHLKVYQNTPAIAVQAKAKKLKMGSWTVNKLEDLSVLQAQGVTLITTNQPMEFMTALKAL